MQLNDRKRAILSAIVKTHILTGEPVGSKALSQIFNFGLSPATLRNEMSDLCELGLLEQPHTSAGRVPSHTAYRLYAENLINIGKVPSDIRNSIDSMFAYLPSDPEYIPREATRMLSQLTGLTAISATIVDNDSSVVRVNLMPLGRRTVMLMLVTSTGAAKNRICRSNTQLDNSTLALFNRLVNEKIIGAKLKSLTPAFMQTLISSAGVEAFSVISLVTSLFGIINDIQHSKVCISGESNLFKHLKSEAQAGRLLEFISRSDAICELLSKMQGNIGLVFGKDTDISALGPTCMIVAKYKAGNSAPGRIGIIGPTRMAYENVIPSIEYFAYKLGNAMTEALSDMEVE